MSVILLILSALGLVAAALLCLSILVAVHEFGHFLVAKLNGIWVEEFGIGLPPRVWGKKIGDTLYSLNAIPLGGFVKLHGETNSDQIYDPNRAFVNKGALAKSLVIIAGIVVNFLFGILLFAFVYSFIPDQKSEPLGKVEVLDVVANSPAQTAGILVGDRITEINDQKVTKNEEVQNVISQNKGKKIKIELEREIDSKVEVKTIVATIDQTEGKLGIAMTDVKITQLYPPLWQRPLLGIKRGLVSTFDLTKRILLGFRGIASEAREGRISKDLSGPVGLIAIIAYVFQQGILEVIHLTAVISINLAIFNILPIPPLDGSRLAVILGEKLFGKKMSPKIENFVNIFGVALLVGLVVVVSAREIPAFISAGSLNKFIETTLLKN